MKPPFFAEIDKAQNPYWSSRRWIRFLLRFAGYFGLRLRSKDERGVMSINYIIGDPTRPVDEGPKMVVHICGITTGRRRCEFATALSNRWAEPEMRYRARHWSDGTLPLGQIQLVQAAFDIWVCNVISQRDIPVVKGTPPVRYHAIRRGLQRVAEEANRLKVSIHMPRVGCRLAGGKWRQISKIIEEELVNKGLAITVYDLASEDQYRP